MGLLEYIFVLGISAAAMAMSGLVGYCVHSGKDVDGTRWLASGGILMSGLFTLLFKDYIGPQVDALYRLLSAFSANSITAAVAAYILVLVLMALSIMALLGLGFFAGTRLARVWPDLQPSAE